MLRCHRIASGPATWSRPVWRRRVVGDGGGGAALWRTVRLRVPGPPAVRPAALPLPLAAGAGPRPAATSMPRPAQSSADWGERRPAGTSRMPLRPGPHEFLLVQLVTAGRCCCSTALSARPTARLWAWTAGTAAGITRRSAWYSFRYAPRCSSPRRCSRWASARSWASSRRQHYCQGLSGAGLARGHGVGSVAPVSSRYPSIWTTRLGQSPCRSSSSGRGPGRR
jgi:hypothetical protein